MVLASVLVAALAASVPASPASDDTLPPVGCVRLLREARTLIERGERAEGVARLREAVETYPRELLPVLELWSAYRDQAASGDDAAEIRSLLTRRLDDPQSALPPGLLEQLAGNPEVDPAELRLFLEGARRRLAASPEDAGLLRAVASLEQRLELPEDTRATLGRLLALADDPALRWRCIDLDIDLGRWEDVLQLLGPWLADRPRTPLVRNLYLTALGKLGRADELTAELARLADDQRILREGIAEILLQAAWDLRDLGRDTDAERYFRRVLEADPENAEARAAVLHLYSTAEERRAQAATLERPWETESDPPRLLDRGTNLFAAGDPQAALPLLRRAAEALPDSETAWFNLGLCAYRLERWELAADALARSTAINPARAEALFNRGAALSKLERWKEAIRDLERALTLDPELDEVHYYLYVCHRALGNDEAALREYRLYND